MGRRYVIPPRLQHLALCAIPQQEYADGRLLGSHRESRPRVRTHLAPERLVLTGMN